MNEITSSEISRLKVLEKIIKSGEKTFIEVGLALAEIQERKLYRAEHGTFEKYCERTYGWSKQHGYRLINAAPIAKSNPQVTNLAAAKALAKVPPPRRPGVVQKIVAAGQKVTAAAVSKAFGGPPRKPATRFLDGTGLEIPPEVLTLWNRGQEAQDILTKISAVRGALKSAQEEKDILFTEVDFTDNLAKLNQVYLDLQQAKPFAVCPSCNGISSDDCPTCRSRGFVSEFYWKHKVPAEIKELTGRK